MADKTVAFRPTKGRSYAITGSDADTGVLGAIERDEGRYEEGITALLVRALSPGSVAVDVGANIGVLTVLMADACGPTGRVLAFEPAAANFAYLQANVRANGLANVDASMAAVTADDGNVELVFNEAYPAGSFVVTDGSGGTSVEGVRLDTVVEKLALERLDLVKVDVEGGEFSVLAGARATIDRFHPLLVVECNPPPLRRVSGSSYLDLFSALRASYPTVAAATPDGDIAPLGSAGDLELLLGHHGVVDLVALTDRHRVAVNRRALERIARRHNDKKPPYRNYFLGRGVSFEPGRDSIEGAPGEAMRLPLVVVNRSRWWLSSDFEYVPINLAYHWVDASGAVAVFDGHRTPFPTPLGPGRAVRLDLTVELPAEPGRYDLVITMVQESFGWADQIDPRCRRLVPAVVG